MPTNSLSSEPGHARFAAIQVDDLGLEAQQVTAQRALRIATRLLGRPCELLPVQMTTKSQLFRLEAGGGSYALKLHSAYPAYEQELRGYRLLQGSGLTPRLHYHQHWARCLVLEWVDTAGQVATDVATAGHWLGAAHGALERAMAQCRGAALGEELVFSSEAEAAFWMHAAHHLGKSYRCCSLGDIKRDHLLVSADRAVWVDLETFSLQRTQLSDLVQLFRNFSGASLPASQAVQACKAYLAGHARFWRSRLQSGTLLELVRRFSELYFRSPLTSEV